MARRFALREGSDGFGHLFHGEVANQTLVCVVGNPAGDALPTQLLGRWGAGRVGVRRVEPGVENGYVVSQVMLARYRPGVGLEFPHEGFFFPDTMEIKKGFGACIPIPEPAGWTEVAISRHGVLKLFRQLALSLGKEAPHFFVCGVFLQLDLSQLDLLSAGPDACLFSFAILALQSATLPITSSSHLAQSQLDEGLVASPDHALSISALSFFSHKKVTSKNRDWLLGGGWRPQILMVSGEWSESFLMEAADSTRPPLLSMPWDTMNLSILETAAWCLDLPLSKVKLFLDIFRKLSNPQASAKPYLSVI